METQPTKVSRPVFTIRAIFFLTLLIAVCLGWYRSQRAYRKANQDLQLLSSRLQQMEISIEDMYGKWKVEPSKKSGRLFSNADMSGVSLVGMKITSIYPCFQSTTLSDANLEGLEVIASGASFQRANFDRAKLKGARFTAQGSVFQMATFVDADLTGVIFECSGSSDLQAVTFRRANLSNAIIHCSGSTSFTSVDLTSANLHGADLSFILSDNLTSCYFDQPPTYSAKTRLPPGFDPVAAGWKLVP